MIPNKPNISLLLLTKNEIKNISNLKWVNMCPRINQIVVIDDESTDNTISEINKLSLKPDLKIFTQKLRDFSTQRQYGITKASNKWILWLDADETPSSQMVEFLNNVNLCQNTYSFSRLDNFLGKNLKHGENSKNRFVRLFNKKYGEFVGNVHEIWSSTQKNNYTHTEIIHHTADSVEVMLNKINFYSTLRARELKIQGHSTNLFEIMIFPCAKFINLYLIKLGFLDSVPGLIMALTMSFHSFLVRTKLWKLYQN